MLAELLLGRPIGTVSSSQDKLSRAIKESMAAHKQLGSWVEGCLQRQSRKRPTAELLETSLAPPPPQATQQSSISGAFRYQPAGCAGRALILSVHKGREEGAQEEREKAAKALAAMGYEVTTIVDPTRETCLSEVRKLRDASWSGHGSSVVAIMAHGCDKGGLTYVQAADDMKVSMASLYGMLSSDNCPGLANKPKIWVVQACRKGGDETVQTDDMAGHAPAILGAEHDNLITYATSPGHVAYRGLFWKAVHDIMSGDPERAKMSWLDICGQANHSLATQGITSVEMKTYLRDNLISPAQLGGAA